MEDNQPWPRAFLTRASEVALGEEGEGAAGGLVGIGAL